MPLRREAVIGPAFMPGSTRPPPTHQENCKVGTDNYRSLGPKSNHEIPKGRKHEKSQDSGERLHASAPPLSFVVSFFRDFVIPFLADWLSDGCRPPLPPTTNPHVP
jgi:hypothetical protein